MLRSAGSELSIRWKIPSSFQHHIYYRLTCIDFFYNIITRMGQFMPLSHWSTQGSINMLSHGLVEKHFHHALLQWIVPWFIYSALFDFKCLMRVHWELMYISKFYCVALSTLCSEQVHGHGWKVLSLWISVYDKWVNVSNLGTKPELQMMYAGSKTNLVKKLGATKVNMNALCLFCTM